MRRCCTHPASEATRLRASDRVGESLDKIAAHLDMPEEEVRELAHAMGDKEVVEWCVCDTDNDAAISLPYMKKHDLIVIDEAHEY